MLGRYFADWTEANAHRPGELLLRHLAGDLIARSHRRDEAVARSVLLLISGVHERANDGGVVEDMGDASSAELQGRAAHLAACDVRVGKGGHHVLAGPLERVDDEL